MRDQEAPQVLDIDVYLESAEHDLLVEGRSEFLYPVRRKSGLADFYERLESDLRNQDLLTVADYRVVKEGWAKISRPSLLRMDRATLVRHRPHLVLLEQEAAKWRREFHDLGADTVIRRAYKEVFKDPLLTRACFEVLSYLLQHRADVRGLLPRQVQHSNSTKLIGKESLLLRLFGIWRSEPATWKEFYRFFELEDRPAEFRFFAPRCLCQTYPLTAFNGILSKDSAPVYDFTGLAGTLIVENLETFHSEAAKSRDRLVIWGGGWKATLLRDIHARFPRPILYWGDIDKEGYEIFGNLKGSITDLQATLMDRATIDSYRHLAVKRDPYLGPFQSVTDLQDEYQDVCRSGLCIEQEKIHARPY